MNSMFVVTSLRDWNRIQCDYLAGDAYTYNFYFCDETPNQKWINMVMSPILARLPQMFENLKDQRHQKNRQHVWVSKAVSGDIIAPNKVLTWSGMSS